MSSSATPAATVVGFGGRAPSVVLDLLSKVVYDDSNSIHRIIPQRSSRLQAALLEPPYRTFLVTDELSSTTTSNNGSSLDLLVYLAPSHLSEYLNHQGEVHAVRQTLLSFDSSRTVVVVFDVEKNQLVGGDAATVLQALRGDAAAQQALRLAALVALTRLDENHVVPFWQQQQQQQQQSSDSTTTTTTSSESPAVVLVVGSGGREHALAVALAQSPVVTKVWCCPGNGGTASDPHAKIANIPNGQQDNASVLALLTEYRVTMVVVGPEAPLVNGLVDAIHKDYPSVLVFGPTQAAAQLEASKAFCKDFLQQHKIPTAKYRNFTDPDEALAYVESLADNDRQVVKASGLAAGKGVLLPTTKAETLAAVREIMQDKAFGQAGDTCVIESFLTGPEASCLAFCDGQTAKLLPAAQDHKRALDNDQGLNTGGMGAYAPAPCVTPALQTQILQMCQTTVDQMAARGTPYVGILYAGMMLTPDQGPMVLEYNCRFGDPETQVLLPLLETDLYLVLKACCTGTLASVDVRFKEGTSAATVVCAAQGYPEKYPKGMQITGLDRANALENVKVYHAGTKVDVDKNVTRCSGGRVLAVTGSGRTLKAALQAAYRGVDQLDFVNDDQPQQSLLHRRTDIGHRALKQKVRLGVLGSTRGSALIPVMEAIAAGTLDAEIVAVVSNKASAPILDKGRSLVNTTSSGVRVEALSAKGLTRPQFDAACSAVLVDAGVDFVLCVGYMRILSKAFTDFWAGRCINVHPSLLPKHAGGMDLAVHQAVLDAKETETGCTIHLVTEQVDGGPIWVQKKVAVDLEKDTAESLKAKVQPLEGPAFIEAIERYRKGEVITYADAGVNIDAGNSLVDLIKPFCKATRRPGCDADLGGFGGLFDLAAAGYTNTSDTVLIGATDGVGTKLRIAHATKSHRTVGIDLVAMCVNDLIVAGGEPLFFLDYFATGHLEVGEAAAVVEGIAEGCRQANCGLIGGETAEMPSMYAPGDYDLAGFAVGAVSRSKILPQGVAVGDVLLGLTSSGIHSNGFSLVRKLVAKEGLTFESPCPWDSSKSSVGEALLTPTKIYVKACVPLLQQGLVKAMAHITGGGLLENVPRSLPDGVAAKVTSHPPLSPVFCWLQEKSGLDDHEMLRTFNCGVGMVLIVDPTKVDQVESILSSAQPDGGEKPLRLGELVEGKKEVLWEATLS